MGLLADRVAIVSDRGVTFEDGWTVAIAAYQRSRLLASCALHSWGWESGRMVMDDSREVRGKMLKPDCYQLGKYVPKCARGHIHFPLLIMNVVKLWKDKPYVLSLLYLWTLVPKVNLSRLSFGGWVMYHVITPFPPLERAMAVIQSDRRQGWSKKQRLGIIYASFSPFYNHLYNTNILNSGIIAIFIRASINCQSYPA